VPGVKAVDSTGLRLTDDVRDYARRTQALPHLSDEAVLHAVVDAFRFDPRLQTSKPTVAVRGGSVALVGVVFDLRARIAAEEDAANTVGVVAVKDALAVEPAGAVKDTTISSEVVEALRRDPILSRRAIRVTVERARVILNGIAWSPFEREHAAVIASAPAGVQSVTNAIEVVVPPATRSDAEIAAEIRHRLAQGVYALPDRVVVEVTGGVVTLSGTVSSWPEWQAAVRAVVESGGLSIVNRLLIVSPRD
jgi:osmotically-inducible protein OsmY